MRRVVRYIQLILGIVLALIGFVWLLQGLNVLPGSFMTGQNFWAVAGFVTLVIGAGLAYTAARGGRQASGT